MRVEKECDKRKRESRERVQVEDCEKKRVEECD